MDIMWSHVTYFLLIIKLVWIIQNRRKSMKDYIIFSIIFSLVILCLITPKISFIILIKQTINFIDKIPYFLELIIFFLLFLIFAKKFSILQCLYLQMVAAVIVFFFKEIILPYKWMELSLTNESFGGFNRLLDNFIYFLHNKVIYSYTYNNFFFNTLTFLYYLNSISDMKNLDMKEWDKMWKSQNSTVYGLIFLVFSIFLNNLWFPNLYWFKIQMDLLIILLLYMHNVGRFIFIDYIASKVPQINRMVVFFIVYGVTEMIVSKENKSTMKFLLGFFAYMLEVIFKIF